MDGRGSISGSSWDCFLHHCIHTYVRIYVLTHTYVHACMHHHRDLANREEEC